jgi:hypothetical protein
MRGGIRPAGGPDARLMSGQARPRGLALMGETDTTPVDARISAAARLIAG